MICDGQNVFGLLVWVMNGYVSPREYEEASEPKARSVAMDVLHSPREKVKSPMRDEGAVTSSGGDVKSQIAGPVESGVCSAMQAA